MMIFLTAVLVLVVGAVVAAVVGRLGTDRMSAPTGTSAFELPEGHLGERGVDAVRLDQSLRGYNMGQVDAVLDRLFDEIHELRGQLGARSPREVADATLAPTSATGRLVEPHPGEADIVRFRRREIDDSGSTDVDPRG